MPNTIRVGILDDHPGIIDGYRYRLGHHPEIKLVGTGRSGEELDTLVALQPDVLILDINVPISATDPNPYPLLHILPTLLKANPGLNVLIISMYAERALIQAAVEAGASGYILKDDNTAIRELSAVLRMVANGGSYFSPLVRERLLSHTEHTLLTRRQLEALALCAAYPNETLAKLAARMGVRDSTMRNLLSTTYLRLGVRTRSAAVTKARQLGLIPS
jgi:DNA-binding NarL/FixJ family response regulator